MHETGIVTDMVSVSDGLWELGDGGVEHGEMRTRGRQKAQAVGPTTATKDHSAPLLFGPVR